MTGRQQTTTNEEKPMADAAPAGGSGLIAILRGITPDEVIAVGAALVEAGIHTIEVPLNSPDPYRSIERLAGRFGERIPIGAGTVLSVEEVARARAAGAGVIVSPDTNTQVITAALAAGMRPYPGVATPTEAFTAVRAGARSLKMFPSDALGISGMRAVRAVLPAEVELVPVGGVDESNLGDWLAAGAGGAGLGTSLYRPGDSADEVRIKARRLSKIWASTR
ncbi:2-dehydro-3-deoxy-6-phosphogalactonate aldolase [Nocardia sp. NPDC024068]|uniref:2-dehydro-3-deoxy-6-phosphogalactonate aldolase n=1 Tax=Nocardia sp. NPDC024068 TaxID=3157197 RepID=UPI0033F2520A